MKTLITTICLFAVYTITGQNIDRQVIASSGNTFDTPSTKLTYTIGEPAVGYIDNSVTISQGFLAKLQDENSLSNDNAPSRNNIKLYPNPVTEFLSIDLKNIVGTAKLKIFSISGKLLHDISLKEKDNQANLSHLPNGTYLLTLELIESKTVKSFKIIKK